MRILPAVIVAVAAAAVLAVVAGGMDAGPKTKHPFHVTLADPDLYADGIYAREFELKGGAYLFRFTPNGDSPKTLTINLSGVTVSFQEDFILNGTRHDQGISSYHTWEYVGGNGFVLDQTQTVRIEIDPNGNVMGPVSVSIVEA